MPIREISCNTRNRRGKQLNPRCWRRWYVIIISQIRSRNSSACYLNPDNLLRSNYRSCRYRFPKMIQKFQQRRDPYYRVYRSLPWIYTGVVKLCDQMKLIASERRIEQPFVSVWLSDPCRHFHKRSNCLPIELRAPTHFFRLGWFSK